LIILSNGIKGENAGLGYIDITVETNAYGRQIDSFEESVDLDLNYNLNGKNFNAVFIRAPMILKAGGNVKILGKLNGSIIMARENNILVSVFHPELEDDIKVHQYFIEMIKEFKKKGD